MPILLLLISLVLLPATAVAERGSDNGKPEIIVEGQGSGAGFQGLLVDAIRSADRIVVTEHSNLYDSDNETTERFDGPYFVYASHELAAAERLWLLRAVESADPLATQDPMCGFSPHHAVEFYVGGRRDSTLEICFTCDQLQWDAVKAFYPDELLPVLRNLIATAGLTADQGWREKLRTVERDTLKDEYTDPAAKRWPARW
ncbi:MAG: hypothetical protein JNN30_11705 [Rhodanobacteraceae bacterium]|nr:hypothetical protein [Rhodanobacteraceae bacterium]